MKVMKQGTKLNVKLSLPKDLHWKVLGSLIKDLGFEKLLPHTGTRYEVAYALLKEFGGVVRNRDQQGLYKLLPRLAPQRIRQMTGADKQDAYAFFCLYQVSSFLKKFPFRGTDTKQPAIEKFKQSERICKVYNDENHRALMDLNDRHPNYLGVVEEIRADILALLGKYPDIDCITSHASHGPGVSLGNLYKGGEVTEYYKWQKLPYTVTRAALPLAKTVILSDPRWIGALDDWYRTERAIPIGHPIDITDFWSVVLEVVDGSRTTTVPKTAEIDRTIAIEPLLNVFFQLGVDFVIRKALRRAWGYDLNSQVRNQVFAQEASINGDLTTVDLSMASDLISLKICELLLPAAWFDLLHDLRCPITSVGKEVFPLEKVSSMGNGFTFALESLIFASLVRCAVRRTKSERKTAVYGDDLIVPTTAYPYLLELINLSGFLVNVDKTYSEGPFRESCGKDYFLGYDVRPIFLKRTIQSVQDLFYLHNSLFSLQGRLDWTWGVDLTKTLDLIKSWIPIKYRIQFYGPESESLDTHLFSLRRLPRNEFGQRVYWQITASPIVFNHGSRFYFRKLMVTLGTRRSNPHNRWDSERRFNTGNAFDITKRGRVLFISTQVALY